MFARFRAFFDRIVFAGLKPSGYGPDDHLDPLYLSNRSMARKTLSVLAVVLPFALIVTGVYLAASGYFSDPPPPPPNMDATYAKASTDPFPNLKGARVDTVRDVAVGDIRLTRGSAAAIEGTLRNTTTRRLRSIEVVFDLTDAGGSQLGGVTVRVDKLEPDAVANFSVPIKQQNASLALVREIRAL